MAIMRPVANVISPEKASQPQPCCPRLLNQTHNRKAPAPISVAPNKSVSRAAPAKGFTRSEEHTSELQSLMRISYAVFCLKKKKHQKYNTKKEHQSLAR